MRTGLRPASSTGLSKGTALMPRRAAVTDTIYLDEAEGFLLEHARFSPTRSWRPLAPETTQAERLTAVKRKMDWEGEVKAHPDEPIELPVAVKRETGDEDANSERCVICLMALRDRTIVGVCGHEFCFECIGVWANQSRRCPLCSTDMSAFLLHDLDSSTPTKFYLPPLPQKKVPSLSLPGPSRRPILPEERLRMQAEKQELDELDLQVERRKEIYEHELYVKHIASNPTTRFRPNPTPRQIADNPELTQKATAFLRRELRVWSLVDVEFLTTHILSLLKAIDIRSEPAVRLLSEILDTPNGPRYPHGAEHFAHEIYSFLRSPFKELYKYDEAVQYDPIPRSRPASLSPSPSVISSRSPSPRSAASRSRSPLPPRSPRDPFRRDTFIPSSPRDVKRWNEADTWLDPEYAAWLEDEKQRAEERRARREGERRLRSTMSHDDRGRGLRGWSPKREEEKPVELLPSPPPPLLRMDEDLTADADPSAGKLTIRGAAAAPRKTLLERLAAAKAEAAEKVNDPLIPPPLPHSISDPVTSAAVPNITGVRAAVQARLRLKLKLASEKKAFVFNQNESRAQALRAMILEAKARREATETDNVLRHMDRLDRAREIRRRLMVEKMMAAETEAERKARELKERLMGEKKARMLREKLKQRKKSQGEALPIVAVL